MQRIQPSWVKDETISGKAVGMGKSSPPWMFLGKDVLKICSKFTGEHPCQSVISINLLCNFIEITLWPGCSPVNLLQFSEHLFVRTPMDCEKKYLFFLRLRTICYIQIISELTAWKVSENGFFLVRIRENTVQKKLRILTLFTQWLFLMLYSLCIFLCSKNKCHPQMSFTKMSSTNTMGSSWSEQFGRSFTYSKNSKGPKSEPRGTPKTRAS